MTEQPAKPPHGSPCNSCGRCCESRLCPLGVHVFEQIEGPCPALLGRPDGKTECGLVVAPRRFVPTRVALHGAGEMKRTAMILIGNGVGCDAVAAGEQPNAAYSASLMFAYERIRPYIERAKSVWGIGQPAAISKPPRRAVGR